MEGSIEIAPGTSIPAEEIAVRATRSSGPGGQHANVSETRIEASFDAMASQALSRAQRRLIVDRLGPVVTAVAQDTRSQTRNRRLALERLRERLTKAVEPRRRRRPTRPGRAATERRLQAKRRRSELKRARRAPPPD